MSKRFNKVTGSAGEQIAEAYLKRNGYLVLAKNYKTEIGEIDLVVSRDEYLVFVEVKARTSEEYGQPAEAVTYAKQRKINMVASQYIKQNMYFGAAVRFDVVEVSLADRSVNHIENAFDSYLKY